VSDLITVSIISSLEGYTGSNPEIVQVYPESSLKSSNTEILEKSLPTGAIPKTFYENKLHHEKILVYTFEVNQAGRNDLASIGFTLDKYAIVDDLKKVVSEIIDVLNKNDKLTFKVLKTNLPKIMESLNTFSPLEITEEGVIIETLDIKNIMKTKKLELKSKERVRRGII
jgi:hypothetical protein